MDAHRREAPPSTTRPGREPRWRLLSHLALLILLTTVLLGDRPLAPSRQVAALEPAATATAPARRSAQANAPPDGANATARAPVIMPRTSTPTPPLLPPTPPPTVTPAPTPTPTATPEPPVHLATDLPDLIESYADQGLELASVIVRDPQTGLDLEINPDEVMATASLYKLFLLWRVQEGIAAGELSEDTDLVLTPDLDRAEDDGHQLMEHGDWTSVAYARRIMITESNNTAAWMLARAVGWTSLGPMLRAHGYDGTTLSASEESTTARDVDRYLTSLIARDLSPTLADSDYELMLGLLADQELNDYLSPGFGAGARFAHKTGEMENVMHDAGILLMPDGRSVSITVMTQGDPDACLSFMRAAARLIWRALTQPAPAG